MNDKKQKNSAQKFEYSAGPKKKQHSYKNKKKQNKKKRLCKTKHLHRECHARLIFCLCLFMYFSWGQNYFET